MKKLISILLSLSIIPVTVMLPTAYAEEDSNYPYVEEDFGDGYIESTYGYPIFGDPYNTKQVKQGIEYSSGKKALNPAMWLRDSDYFGVWDESTSKWTTEPKLDYDAFEGLAHTEAAAKRGDYEDAKLAYYNYYVEKEKGMNRPLDISDSKASRLTSDLLCKNFMYNAQSGLTIQEIMKIGNAPQYRNCDVSSIVTSKKGTRTEMVFWILATDKNGDYAEFDSKEAENKPFLRLNVDGAEVILYATEDTNIKAGNNATVTYGSDTILTAREDEFGTVQYTHDGLSDTTHLHVNENTSRIYMKFDISSLSTGDTINSATLNLYGHNIVDGAEKEVVVFYSDDSSWSEDTLTYNNATAQVIYSYDQALSWYWNQPKNAGSRYQEELLRFNTWFDKLLDVYNYSGDEKYAYTAIRMFMDYINVRGDDTCWLKSLDVAVRTQCMPGLWMQLLNSKYMTPEVFTAFMKWCFAQGECSKKFTRTGNWGTSESLGLYTLAINYPEFKNSEEWLERVRVRYESLSNDLIKDDYCCTELSLGYTDYSLTTLIDAKTAAEDLGIDFEKYTPYSEKTLANINNLTKFMYWTSLPGISDNQVGDGYSHRGNFKSRVTSIADWLKDDNLLYAAYSGKKGKKPDFTSKMYPNGKKVVLRTGWDDNAYYMFTDADGGVGNHAHPDDNNIVVMANGQYLLVDPLYGTYSASASKTWLTSSIAHNIVVMNGKNQTYNASASVGSIPHFETNNSYDFVTTDAKSTQDADSYKRSTFFYRGKFFLVNDYIVPKASVSSASNKYVQAWHYLPEAAITMDADNSVTKTNIEGANIQVVPFNTDALERSEIVDGLYSEGQGSIISTVYTEYEKHVTGNAVFNTLLLPETQGQDYDVSVGEIDVDGVDKTQASALEFYLTDNLNGKTKRYIYYLRHDASAKSTIKIDEFTTDASMLFIEMDQKGNVEYIALQNGSMLTKGSKSIFKSDTSYGEFSAQWQGSSLSVDSSIVTAPSLKANNVALRGGFYTVKTASVNGTETTVTTVDGVTYFGTAPSGSSASGGGGSSSGGSSSGGGQKGSSSGSGGTTSSGAFGNGSSTIGTTTPVEAFDWAKWLVEPFTLKDANAIITLLKSLYNK